MQPSPTTVKQIRRPRGGRDGRPIDHSRRWKIHQATGGVVAVLGGSGVVLAMKLNDGSHDDQKEAILALLALSLICFFVGVAWFLVGRFALWFRG